MTLNKMRILHWNLLEIERVVLFEDLVEWLEEC